MPKALPVRHQSVPAAARWQAILIFGCALALTVLLALAAPIKGGAGLTGQVSLESEPVGP